MEIAHGNWNEAPQQPVRAGITRVVLAGHETKDFTLAMAKCENGNAKRPHKHPHAQLAIVVEGECDYYVDGTPYKMKPGSWLFVPANVEHYIDVQNSPVPVMNLDVFIPSRPEYVEEYDEFLKTLDK